MQVGLASVASTLQATGGTTALSAAALADRLETMGAALDVSTTQQATALNFECLVPDLQDVLSLVAAVLQCAPPPSSQKCT